jgi:hypothetical protein
MQTKLWYMNADFEMEFAAQQRAEVYRRSSQFDKINRRLAAHLLWLAKRGDALLLEGDEAPDDSLAAEAKERGVELLSKTRAGGQSDRIFTPWGWTKSAVALGEGTGASVRHPSLEIVARVNSKLWSDTLEQILGVALKHSAIAPSFDELQGIIERACPKANDKWVIKSPFGFAARDRVLGRGAVLEAAQAVWVQRRLALGETLLFQPWLDVVREYGVVMNIRESGEVVIEGISDLQTNGAGTGYGYLLGRAIEPQRKTELEGFARIVGTRLFEEGYTGAAGMDALEHANGLHPLLEINARLTMGHVAVAVEQALHPATPVLWRTK